MTTTTHSKPAGFGTVTTERNAMTMISLDEEPTTTEDEGWETAHCLIGTATPVMVLAYLRLLLPCKVCGAAPLTSCVRGVGEVNATHATRGE